MVILNERSYCAMLIPDRFRPILEQRPAIPGAVPTARLDQIGHSLGLSEGMRMLDLACGSGELLARWSRDHRLIGVGVDSSESLIEAARQRADELEVLDQLHFVVDVPAEYPQPFHEFDVVCCLNTPELSSRLVDTLSLIQAAMVSRTGTAIIGTPYWKARPSTEVSPALGPYTATYADLSGILDQIESVGMEMVEMALASDEDRDRRESARWLAADTWLRENVDHPDAPALYEWLRGQRRRYLTHERAVLGWGVFVLRM
jgi:SAM-dependent methyltransferase